jgi:lysophospholipase L1-like esterase
MQVIGYAPVASPSLGQVLSNHPASSVAYVNPPMRSTNVQDAILEAYNHAPTVTNTRVILPNTLTAVVGDKLQLFTRGIVEAQNPYALPVSLIGTAGTSYARYWEWTPTAAGAQTLSVNVADSSGAVLASNSVTINAVTVNRSPGTNRCILCVGDSLTAGGVWPAELYRRLTQTGGTPAGSGLTNFSFVGDTGMPGYSGQYYIGTGGWSWRNYTGADSLPSYWLATTNVLDCSDKGVFTDAATNWWTIVAPQPQSNRVRIVAYSSGYTLTNSAGTLNYLQWGNHTNPIVYTAATATAQTPFWDGSSLSFRGFATNNGVTNIDAVYVLLGWNGLNGPNAALPSSHTNQTEQTKILLNQLHSDYPNALVRIVGIETPSINGGLGASYGSGWQANYYSTLRSVNGLRQAYRMLATNVVYSSWVKYIDVASQFDSENNFPSISVTVNSRNTVTETRDSNGIHPSNNGYYQIADAIYRDVIATFCQ